MWRVMMVWVATVVVVASGRRSDPPRCSDFVSTIDKPIQLYHRSNDSFDLSVRLPRCIGSPEAKAVFGSLERQRCISRSLINHLRAVQPSNAWVSFCMASALVRRGVLNHCHQVAHDIGDFLWAEAVNKSPLESNDAIIQAGKALGKCTFICSEACGHPVMEGVVRATVELHKNEPGSSTLSARLKHVISTLCLSPEIQAVGGCFSQYISHGGGHGMVQALRGGRWGLAWGLEWGDRRMPVVS